MSSTLLELYAGAIFAQNPAKQSTSFGACAIWSTSKEHGLNKAIEIAREAYPVSDGWLDHRADITIVPGIVKEIGEIQAISPKF